jgi:hypothetical protein
MGGRQLQSGAIEDNTDTMTADELMLAAESTLRSLEYETLGQNRYNNLNTLMGQVS